MKKTLIAIALMVSSSAMAQTNYNTIMNPKHKRDSLKKEINLHLNKAATLERVGNGLVITAIISAIATYHLCDGRQSIYVPLAIGGGALFTYHLSEKQEIKADKLKLIKMEKEINSFEDLVFTPHKNGVEGAVQAQHTFPNDITISVVGGYTLYGDGINSFEIAAWHKEGHDWLRLSEHDDVIGWRSKEDVTEMIKKIKDM